MGMRLAQPTCFVAAKPGLYCCSATVCPLAKSSRQHSGAKIRWVIVLAGNCQKRGQTRDPWLCYLHLRLALNYFESWTKGSTMKKPDLLGSPSVHIPQVAMHCCWARHLFVPQGFLFVHHSLLLVSLQILGKDLKVTIVSNDMSCTRGWWRWDKGIVTSTIFYAYFSTTFWLSH